MFVTEGLPSSIRCAVGPTAGEYTLLSVTRGAARYPRPVRIGLTILGLLLAGAGVVWILQGLRVAFAPRSFMTGDPVWIALGLSAVLVGLALVIWSRRSG